MGPSDAGGGTCAPSTPPGRSCRSARRPEGANGHVNEGKVENRKVSRTKGNSHTARLGAVWEILPPFFEARIVCFVKIFTTNQDENVKVDLACGLGYCVSAAPHPQQLRLRENGAVGFIQSYGELISVEVGKRGRAGPLALESTPAAGNRREKWQRWCSGKDDGSRAVRPNSIGSLGNPPGFVLNMEVKSSLFRLDIKSH
ncbi:hypothetical protein MJG53_015746 [Ovis ammon polii x Ovis aries]|uniref:Uncharacterized protein n=1 Tax=Ovis ammon polii x Ovis aries TaxID=2918886 RepID=A0ACB9UC37_9CETA|nr:hypothetical protein MJG53_015746 [Ovis ammon polii x Ovis aries]